MAETQTSTSFDHRNTFELRYAPNKSKPSGPNRFPILLGNYMNSIFVILIVI